MAHWYPSKEKMKVTFYVITSKDILTFVWEFFFCLQSCGFKFIKKNLKNIFRIKLDLKILDVNWIVLKLKNTPGRSLV